jgi:hypothetical protein
VDGIFKWLLIRDQLQDIFALLLSGFWLDISNWIGSMIYMKIGSKKLCAVSAVKFQKVK